MKSTHQAVVVPVVLENHPNADSLSVVPVFDGVYKVVVRTEDWQGKKLAIYIPPESLVPLSVPEFSWLGENYIDRDYFRVKAVKLRGVHSHGLFVPAREHHNIGDDVTEEMGVKHYEPPTGSENDPSKVREGGHHFSSVSKYDVDGPKSFYRAISDGTPCVALEKLNGENCRVFYCEQSKEIIVGSRTRWLKYDPNGRSNFSLAIKNAPRVIEWCKKHPYHLVYGESIGTVGGFSYSLREAPQFHVFDIMRPDFTYYDYIDLNASDIGPQVPLVKYFKYDWSLLCESKLEEGLSLLDNKTLREGVVIRPVKEMQNKKFQRCIFKIVNPKYLEK